MFYRPKIDGHGLPHNPLKAVISPRPIAWVSSRGPDGRDNLAPFSFFNGIADDPPMLMVSFSGRKVGIPETKDTLRNIRDTGVFAVNIVAFAMREAMNLTSGPYEAGDDEFAVAGVEKLPCREIDAARVGGAPATLECRLHQIVDLPAEGDAVENTMAIGRIVGIHLDERCLRDGIFDVTVYNPVSRLGYRDYSVVREVFQMTRPGSRGGAA